MQTKFRCAIYTRISTDQQAEKVFNSCEAQEEKIRAFIKSQENMEVYKVYSDAGYTGVTIQPINIPWWDKTSRIKPILLDSRECF